eukprot:37030_1
MTNDCSYFVLEETESNMLVFAFIRLTITKHASNMYMPPYLIHLFVTFYYEAMPTFNITKYGSINYSQFEISRNITSDNKYPKVYCVSQIPWSSGIHEFKIKCTNISDGSNAIGVVSNPIGFVTDVTTGRHRNDWAFDSSVSGITYQIYFTAGKLQKYDGIYVNHHGTQMLNEKLQIYWKDNDVVKFNINCDEWTLMFYINEKQVGPIVHLIQDVKYYAAVAFGGSNETKYQFIV